MGEVIKFPNVKGMRRDTAKLACIIMLDSGVVGLFDMDEFKTDIGKYTFSLMQGLCERGEPITPLTIFWAHDNKSISTKALADYLWSMASINPFDDYFSQEFVRVKCIQQETKDKSRVGELKELLLKIFNISRGQT